jgi:DNA-binding transcriptional LysR family regulator
MNPRLLDRWLTRNAPDATIAMRLDSASAIREAIRAGIGVQLLATYDGDADPNLVRIGAPLDNSHGLWLLTLPELRATTRVRAFMVHMVDAPRGVAIEAES